jgi:isopentenyl diphosphate isomerase/L-lactate dehydrogenase-like FMN-dependent dehydrogenase
MRAGEPAPLNLRPYGNTNRGVRKREPVGKLIKTHADWEDVRHLRERWKGKLVLKGLMSADDAVRASSIGCDAVWVSNHGGRVLESAPATIDCLAPIVEALGGRAEVLIDGGFNSGEDVVKALALGADMVFLGRGPLYGLAAAADAGVRRALDIYKSDVHRTMLHIGSPNVASLRKRDIVLRPGAPLPTASRAPNLKATA